MHRQTTTIITATEITQTGGSTNARSDQLIDLCVLRDPHAINYFASLGIFICEGRRT